MSNPERSLSATDRNQLLRIQRLIRQQPARTVIAHARLELHPRLYPHLVEIGNRVSANVLTNNFPRTLQQTKTPRLLSAPTTIHRELLWATAQLESHGDQLKRFLVLTKPLDRAQLLEDYGVWETILDAVESEFGWSLWLIKQRTLLFQSRDGLEGQKQFTRSIIKSAPTVTTLGFITHYVSVRNEPSVTPAGFWDDYLRHTTNTSTDEIYEAYFRFHIKPELSPTIDDMRRILVVEQSSALIDYFTTFVRLVQLGAAIHQDELRNTLRTCAHRIHQCTDDPKLLSVLNLLGDVAQYHIAHPHWEATCHLNHGRYSEALNIAIENIERGEATAWLLDIAGQSLARTEARLIAGPRSLMSAIVNALATIICYAPEYEQDAVFLLKTISNYEYSGWALPLMGTIMPTQSYQPLQIPTGPLALCVATSPPPATQTHVDFPEHISRGLATSLGSTALSCNALKPYFLRETQLTPYRPADSSGLCEWTMLAGLASYRSADYELAAAFAEDLRHSLSPVHFCEGTRILTASQLQLSNAINCVHLIANAVSENPEIWRILPIAQTHNILDRQQEQSLRGTLVLPVFYDILGRRCHVSDRVDTRKRHAWDDFLQAQEVMLPSELRSANTAFPPATLAYYLREVCTETLMSKSIRFSKSRDVTLERLAILRWLISLDPERATRYEAEIKSLHRDIRLADRAREVDQSKIYINTEGIHTWAQTNLTESFTRMMSYLESGFTLGELSEIESAIAQAVGGDLDALSDLTLPENEMSELFVSVVQRLLHEYTLGAKHGLNGYLSTRVRHNTLSNQVRSAVEQAKLVTDVDYNTEQYITNTHWIEILYLTDSPMASAVDCALKRFSAGFDRLVEDLVVSRLQIRRAENEQGLFDFEFTAGSLRLMSAYIQRRTTLDIFVDRILLFFETRLNSSLDVVRAFLNTEIKSAMAGLFDQLEQDLLTLGAENVRPLLNALPHARTAVTHSIDEIIGWFNLSKSIAKDPFEIADAIEIAAESVRTARADFKCEIIDPDGNAEILMHGSELPSFVDIFFILFNNVVKHSSTTGDTPQTIVTLEANQTSLSICVSNQMRPDADPCAVMAELNRIKHLIVTEEHMSSIGREGGTGLHKVHKILEHDLAVHDSLAFDVCGNEFQVLLSLPIRFQGTIGLEGRC